jgi:NodT family efflux transporter outer membrane factor (OMF) lipoprotein
MSRIGLLLIVFLAGCATPVPRALPPTLLPGNFGGIAPSGTQLWPDSYWWRGFGDAQLTALVEEAQAQNRDLAIAAARVLQAEAQTTITRSTLFPELSGGPDYQAGGCRGQSCRQYSAGQAFGLQISASYELDFRGLARANLRAANEQLKFARFAQQSVALTVTSSVASQYLTVLSLRRRIAIDDEYIAAINSILEVIKLRVKAGAASHLDLAREQAQIEAVQAQLPSLETLEKQALYALAVLLGKPPEGFDVALNELDAVLAPPVAAGLPSDLLLRRPDIAQAEANLASAHASVDAARAAFLPQISLTGSGGTLSGAIGTLLQASNLGYTYGASLLQTIFDGGKLVGEKHLAEATQKEYVAAYQSATLNAYADVEFSLVEVANTGRAESHLLSLITAAQEAFQISELQYRQGAADLLTVLQAQQTLFSAEDQLAQTVLANRLASIHLYEALGGGWVEKPEERTQLADTR